MARLNKIHIQNYRVHKNTKIFTGTKKIGSFLVLVGKNDIGKTTILNALDVFFNGKDICDGDFYQDDQEIIIECTFGDELLKRSIPKNGKYIPNLCRNKLYKLPKFAFFDITNQYDYSEIANYTIDDLIMVVENQISRFIKYNKDEYFDDNIENFAEDDELTALLLQWKDLLEDFNQFNKKISIISRGAGVQRVCALYFHIMQSIMKSNVAEYIFAIDEPELSLHPEQQRKFIQILKSVSEKFTNIQIIIATHSPYVVNEVKYKDIFVLTHKTKRNKKGKVIELPEICVNSLKSRVFKNYNSMAEINYLAFDECSKDYHIELFGYMQNKIHRNVSGLDDWLDNHSDAKKGTDNWYDTRTYVVECRTIPFCVRNNIDHPLITCPPGHNTTLFKRAKRKNSKYDDINIIKKSIEFMRKAIIDNNL